jgi:glutamine cyclotransferase
MRMRWELLLAGLAAAGLFACQPNNASPPSAAATPPPNTPPAAELPPEPDIPTYRYKIVNTFPHDPQAFTQGLEFHDGYLYEGTGQYGKSSLRRVETAHRAHRANPSPAERILR